MPVPGLAPVAWGIAVFPSGAPALPGEDGEPMLHLHVVLGTRDCTALAGHLSEAHVRPTLEVMLTETPAHLQRVEDRATGLALIRAEG